MEGTQKLLIAALHCESTRGLVMQGPSIIGRYTESPNAMQLLRRLRCFQLVSVGHAAAPGAYPFFGTEFFETKTIPCTALRRAANKSSFKRDFAMKAIAPASI